MVSKLLTIVIISGFNLIAQTITVTSPSNNQVVTSLAMPITVSLSNLPSVSSVEYTMDGRLVENGIVRSSPWGMTYYPYLQGDSTIALVATAKDVFGAVLATSATVNITTKLTGATAYFVSLPNPVTGTAASIKYQLNHPYANPDGNISGLSIDGTQNIGWGGGATGRLASPPPYGDFVTFDSTKHLNGPHELFVYTAYQNNGLNHINTGTFSFPSTAVTIGAGTSKITFNDHLLSDAQAAGFTLTTTGTLPAPLQLATTYYARYVDANNFQIAATQNGAPIDLTAQGTGTHTVNYTINGLGWCDTDAASHAMGCSNSVGSQASGYVSLGFKRQMATFSNGSAAMEMRPPVNYCFLTPGQTCNIAPTVYNTDYSTTSVPATTPFYTYVDDGGVTGCASVSTSGVVTAAGTLPVSPCYWHVNETCASGACNGLTAVTVYGMAMTTNIMPHYDHGGQVRVSYDPVNSFIPRTAQFFGQQVIQNAAWGLNEMQSAGINMARDGILDQLGFGSTTTCSTVTNTFNSYYNAMKPLAVANKFYFWFLNYNWTWAPWQLDVIMRNVGFDRQACAQGILTTLKNDGLTTFLEMQDEFDGEVGADLAPNRVIGGPQFTNLVVDGSGVITFNGLLNATLQNWNQASGTGDSNWVRITGATETALNGPCLVTAKTGDATGRTTSFKCAAASGATAGTKTSADNPNLEIVMWPFSYAFGAADRCYIPGQELSATLTYGWAGTHHFSTITSNGTILTIGWTAHGLSSGDFIRIWSAGTNTNLHTVAKVTVVDANTITIPTLVASGTTVTSATDPNLFVSKVCGFDNHIFSDFMSQVMGVTGRPATLWPLLGSSYVTGQEWRLALNQNATFNTGTFMYFPGQVPAGPVPAYGASQTPYQILTDHKVPLLTVRAYNMEPLTAIHYAQGADYVKASTGFQFNPALDRLSAWYGDSGTTLAKIWYPLAYGAVGFRLYNYGDNPTIAYASSFGAREASGQAGVRHYIYKEQYRPTVLSYVMIHRLEKYLLQPRLNSPYYGPMFYTASRTGSYGNMLLIGSLSEMPYPATGTMTVDLTPCRQTNGIINRYRITPRKVTALILAGNPTSDAVQFNASGEGGEVIFYTCQVAGATPDIDMVPFNPPSTLPAGAAKYAVKIGYYPGTVEEATATDCTAGCSIPVEHSNAAAWYKLIYLGSDNSIKYRGDAQIIPAQHP